MSQISLEELEVVVTFIDIFIARTFLVKYLKDVF